MKNTLLVAIPAVLLGLGIVGYLSSQGVSSNEDIRVIESTALAPDPSVDNGIDLASSGGEYVEFDSSASIESQVGGDKTLLFFHARWCPTCLSLDRNLTAGSIPDGLKILKLDYDDEVKLKERYGVNFQHTIIQVDEEGELVTSFFGSRDIEDIFEYTL